MSSEETTTLSFNADVYRKLFPHEYLKSCISSNVRPDARKFDAARAVHIQTNVVHTAASSSLVRVGNTSVIAAVKLAVGTPAVATPDQGEIAVQVHLTPLCSNRFNLGRPSEEAQSLGSQLMRIVTGARVVEMSDLTIERGKSAWQLMVDVYCLDHDGNVHDASLIAVMAALKTLKLPAVNVNEADHIVTIQPDGEATPLKLQHAVYGTTFAVLNGQVVVDPTSEEETLSSSIFSITYNTELQLAGVHKAGGEVLASETLHASMVVSRDRAQQLAVMVDSATR